MNRGAWRGLILGALVGWPSVGVALWLLWQASRIARALFGWD